MSTPFQNRLVGTIIVAAAAIIFLPDLLDGEKKAFQQQFDEIPKQPEIKINNDIKSFPDDQVEKLDVQEVVDEVASDELLAKGNEKGEANSAKEQTTSSTSVTQDQENVSSEKQADLTVNTEQENDSTVQIAKAEPAKPIALPKQVEHGNAWVIQLGSFRSKQNVDSLLAKLKLNNYVAFTKPISTRSGEMTKVFIGPEVDKSKLETQLEPLFNLTQVRGKISKFKPN